MSFSIFLAQICSDLLPAKTSTVDEDHLATPKTIKSSPKTRGDIAVEVSHIGETHGQAPRQMLPRLLGGVENA